MNHRHEFLERQPNFATDLFRLLEKGDPKWQALDWQEPMGSSPLYPLTHSLESKLCKNKDICLSLVDSKFRISA